MHSLRIRLARCCRVSLDDVCLCSFARLPSNETARPLIPGNLHWSGRRRSLLEDQELSRTAPIRSSAPPLIAGKVYDCRLGNARRSLKGPRHKLLGWVTAFGEIDRLIVQEPVQGQQDPARRLELETRQRPDRQTAREQLIDVVRTGAALTIDGGESVSSRTPISGAFTPRTTNGFGAEHSAQMAVETSWKDGASVCRGLPSSNVPSVPRRTPDCRGKIMRAHPPGEQAGISRMRPRVIVLEHVIQHQIEDASGNGVLVPSKASNRSVGNLVRALSTAMPEMSTPVIAASRNVRRSKGTQPP
jgi:hypothetical protein